MTAKFLFDDYIRCMSARQRLQKRRVALKHTKISTIATLLELPALAAPPSHYYSFTTIDGPNSVWSPSSRGYSSTKLGSSSSSSSSSLSTPSIQKPKLLSPKHEEILLKRNKVDHVDGKPSSLTNTPRFNKSASSVLANSATSEKKGKELVEAESLAALLQNSPPPDVYEIAGRYINKETRINSTTEVGEEIGEDATSLGESSSLILINSSTMVERQHESSRSFSRSKRNRIGFKAKFIENDKSKRERSYSVPVSIDFNSIHVSHGTNNTEINSFAENPSSSFLRSDNAATRNEIPRKFFSAPGSPRGRRYRVDNAYSNDVLGLSKSLPAMALEASNEERRQRAQRARAKAKIVKTRGGKTLKR